ncbi:hypothetical protein ACGFNV_10710 [Streptomyces sp. NPDC048751]|uniref:hypothetical protein n=1 Tax=Streptomyces sp. NPDC048751 TaxID=3365591 RepID=UPI0037210155
MRPGSNSGSGSAHSNSGSGSAEMGAPPAFHFRVPSEFHAVPLGLGDEADVFHAQVRQFARDYWGEREDLEPLRRLTTAMYAANAQSLVEGGTVYNALGIFPIGGGADGSESPEPPERVSRATLTVSVRELDNPDPHFTAAGIAEVLDKGSQGGEVQLVSLPVGPAVVHIAGARAVWDLPEGEADGPGGEQERFFVRIELWVPFPGEDRLLLLCLSTADVQDLFHYQAVLADIADTITFGEAEAEAPAAAVTKEAAPPSPFGSY